MISGDTGDGCRPKVGAKDPISPPAGARAREGADLATHSGKSVRELADALAIEALTIMGEQLRDIGDGTPADIKRTENARRAAARDIMYVWSRMPDADPKSDTRTPEEKRAQLRAAMATPEVRQWLEAEGYERKAK